MLKDFLKVNDKKKRLKLIILVSFLVITCLLISIYFYIIPNGKYRDGVNLINEKEYDKAISLFYDLGDFKDSNEKIFEATVLKAFSLYDKGEYEKAINLLKTIGKEDEVYERIYITAMGYYNRKEFDISNPFFILLGEYKDSKDRIHYHDYKEKTRKDATCINDGYITYYCEGCKSEYQEKIKKTGEHNYIAISSVDATCLESGIVKYQCDMCGKKYSNKISPLGHDYVTESTSATCVKAGVNKKVCSRCGDIVEETVDALGHDYKVISDTTKCLEDGIITYKCKRCKEIKEELSLATGHKMIDATCESAAYCEKCGYIEGTPLGHTTIRGKCERCNKDIYFYDYCTFNVSNVLPITFIMEDSILEITEVSIKEAYNDQDVRLQEEFNLNIKYNYTFGRVAIDKVNFNIKDSNGNEDNISTDIWCLGNIEGKEKSIKLPLIGYDQEIDSNSYTITISIN